jgi:hypothetical protein
MENTAIYITQILKESPSLPAPDDKGYFFMENQVVWAMEKFAQRQLKQLQAKHEEELKQAVVDAIKTDVFPLMDEANFIAKNLKDNPYCTVYRLHELNKNIEDKYGIEIEYTPTGKL